METHHLSEPRMSLVSTLFGPLVNHMHERHILGTWIFIVPFTIYAVWRYRKRWTSKHKLSRIEKWKIGLYIWLVVMSILGQIAMIVTPPTNP